MLSRRLARLQPPPNRLLVARTPTSVRSYSAARKGGPFDQSRQSGFAARDRNDPFSVDAATRQGGKQATHGEFIGNKEGVGFADQVGSQSTSHLTGHGNGVKPESAEGISGQENITPPSFVDAVKDKLGLETTAGEDKQNRGSENGVTGTGTFAYDGAKRTIHTSAASRVPAKTHGQAPEASRQPKDKSLADQNDHLKHKSKATSLDSGKGNAAKDPKLPSHEAAKSQKRAFHTTLSTSQDKDQSGHTADSYFKDVDSTAPVNPKVHQVDSSSGTGAPVARANERPATGHFSRAGPYSPEYATQTSKHDQPYDTKPTKGPEADQKLRYGGRDAQDNTTKSDEGPTGKAAAGRKP